MQSLGDGVQHSLDGVQHSVDVALTEEDRKKLRLQRNREIARNCRKRQREKMEQMEQAPRDEGHGERGRGKRSGRMRWCSSKA